MAEAQRVSSPPVRPVPPPRPRPRAAPRHLSWNETQDLKPPAAVQAWAEPEPVKAERPARPGRRAPAQPRTRAEQALLIVLLLGLALNAGVLLTNSGLTPYDHLLGVTVILAGVALLGLLEVARRIGGRSSDG
jgi:hypothetical protein